MNKTVNIGYYEKKDWDFFLSIIADKERMHDSWDEWHQAFVKLKDHLTSQGFLVKTVTIDLNELINYCIDRKISNDGKARSQFVMDK